MFFKGDPADAPTPSALPGTAVTFANPKLWYVFLSQDLKSLTNALPALRASSTKMRQLQIHRRSKQSETNVTTPSALVVRAPKVCVCIHVNCGQSDLKPDPVCAFDSARKDFAVT